MEATLNHGNTLDPAEWNAFVETSPQGNIYHLHHYLEHLIPGWLAAVLREGGRIVAVFPFAVKTRLGMGYALQPYFAQYLGVLFRPAVESVYKDLEFQKKALQLLHEALPAGVRYFEFNFAPEFNYDLPLLWLGWQQKSRYTYWVDLRGGYDQVVAACASHVRREVKKADQAGLVVREENNPECVVQILQSAKPAAVRQIPAAAFAGLCQNSRSLHAQGKSSCFIGYDGDQPVAGIIYFYFRNKMIYYQGSTLPDYKNSGIMSKIILESIRQHGHRHQYLDFDGSMLEPIERFLRGFGAFPVRYSNFRLNRLPRWAKWAYRLRRYAQ